MTEYTYIELKKDCKSADPSTLSRTQTRQFEAFHGGKQRFALIREGETLTVTAVESGRAVDVPWGNVAFGRVRKPEAAPEPTTGARPSAKFNPAGPR